MRNKNSFQLKKNLAVFSLVLLICTSCRFFQASNKDATKPFFPDEIKNNIPFSTKEPEIFQTEIVIHANGTETKKFIAQKGANRRYDYNYGTKKQLTVLQTDKIYTIFPDRKVYSETNFGNELPVQSDLTGELINFRQDGEFTKIETEKQLTKYQVNLPDNQKSEIMIFFDENLQIPVKQEFYSIEAGQKTLTMKIELTNFKIEVDEKLFVLPSDFNKISAEELRKIIQLENE